LGAFHSGGALLGHSNTALQAGTQASKNEAKTIFLQSRQSMV
jgi:hypothetical protein